MFERFNLRDNAFPVTPNEQDGFQWYGFGSLKQQFEAVMERSGRERLRLCVLNRGKLGVGKTHAAQYFATAYANRQNVGQYSRFLSLVIESPKQPQKAFVDFATRFFNAVTFRRLLLASQNLRALRTEPRLFDDLLRATGSEDVATVLSKINESNLLQSKAFLLGGGTAKELREIGVAKKITSDHEFATTMIGALYLLIHGQSGDQQSICRIVLWVDEMEDLVYFPTRYYLPFTQAMRELIDNTNEHFTLMLNFTFSEPEDLPAIDNVLGQAIMQRVNQHIVFQQPSSEDFREYLIELFAANRIRTPANSPIYPFSEEAFTFLIDAAVAKTPRFLNKLCDMMLRDLETLSNDQLSLESEGIPRSILEDKLSHMLSMLEEARG